MVKSCALLIRKIDSLLLGLNNRTKIIIISLISVVMFLIILQLNILTPIEGDDYVYIFKFPPTAEPIQSFSDLVLSQYNHYMEWGGRTVAHTIAQVLLLCSPFTIDVLQTCAYILFVFIVYFHAKGRNKEHSVAVFLLINLFTWFLQPSFASTILGTTPSSNYLWCFIVSSSFLLVYRFYDGATKQTKLKGALQSLAMLIFGILAGWTNENIGVALLMMLIVFFYYYKKNGWNIPMWAYFGLIGTLAGFLLMILAPGNYVRAEEMRMPTTLFYFSYRIRLHTSELFTNLGWLNILVFVLLVLNLKFSKMKKDGYILFAYYVGVFFSLYSMVLSPYFPARVWFGIITLNVIAICFLLFNMNVHLFFMRCIKYGITTILLVAFPFNFYLAYKEMKHADEIWKRNEQTIRSAQQSNASSVAIESVGPATKFVLGDSDGYGLVMKDYYKLDVTISK